jgi:hypothetical protein
VPSVVSCTTMALKVLLSIVIFLSAYRSSHTKWSQIGLA